MDAIREAETIHEGADLTHEDPVPEYDEVGRPHRRRKARQSAEEIEETRDLSFVLKRGDRHDEAIRRTQAQGFAEGPYGIGTDVWRFHTRICHRNRDADSEAADLASEEVCGNRSHEVAFVNEASEDDSAKASGTGGRVEGEENPAGSSANLRPECGVEEGPVSMDMHYIRTDSVQDPGEGPPAENRVLPDDRDARLRLPLHRNDVDLVPIGGESRPKPC
jgi:hypothetical protein